MAAGCGAGWDGTWPLQVDVAKAAGHLAAVVFEEAMLAMEGTTQTARDHPLTGSRFGPHLAEVDDRVHKNQLLAEDAVEQQPHQPDPAVDRNHVADVPSCGACAAVRALQTESNKRVVVDVALEAERPFPVLPNPMQRVLGSRNIGGEA